MIHLDCYSLIKNTCDGGCQGCSDCPIAKPFHDETASKEITRKMMIKFAIKDIKDDLKVKWFLRRHKKEISEMIAKIIDKHLTEAEEHDKKK